MKPERSFRRLCLLAEALAIEEEDFRQQDSVYQKEFKSDYALEHAFLSQKSNTLETHDEKKPPPEPKIPRVAEQSLKRLHRALAKKTHPDRKHVDGNEEFTKIQTAFEKADVSSLLSSAVKHEINISLDKDDEDQLERQIFEQTKVMKVKKSSLWWHWCLSDKSNSIRNQIRTVMEIDQAEFEIWSSKTASEDT